MTTVISMETILGLLAMEVLEAQGIEEKLGADCVDDTLAAHICGRISGLLDALVKINNLQDPARNWAAGLVAAENRDKIREVLCLAADTAKKREGLRELRDLLDAVAHGHPHREEMN